MEPGDKKEFLIMLVGMGEMFRYSVSELAGEIWFEKMKEYSLKQVKDAFSHYLDQDDYFPTVRKIKDLIEETTWITEDRPKSLPEPDPVSEISDEERQRNIITIKKMTASIIEGKSLQEIEKLLEDIRKEATKPNELKLVKGKGSQEG